MKQPESEPAPESNLDARRKEGKGLDFWAKAMLDQGLVSQTEYEDFIDKNNRKEEVMTEHGVPQLKHYGLFNSTQEIKEKLSTVENQHFIIRCKSKENSEEIKRLVDANLDEVCAFASALDGGFEKWNVEVKEFEPNTIAAGTIIVESSGHTSIETWEGPHYLNVKADMPKYHAELDPDQFHKSFNWSVVGDESVSLKYKQYAMSALRYIFPNLQPGSGQPLYAEYGVRPSGEIYFIEVNDSPIVTAGIKKE